MRELGAGSGEVKKPQASRMGLVASATPPGKVTTTVGIMGKTAPADRGSVRRLMPFAALVILYGHGWEGFCRAC